MDHKSERCLWKIVLFRGGETHFSEFSSVLIKSGPGMDFIAFWCHFASHFEHHLLTCRRLGTPAATHRQALRSSGAPVALQQRFHTFFAPGGRAKMKAAAKAQGSGT